MPNNNNIRRKYFSLLNAKPVDTAMWNLVVSAMIYMMNAGIGFYLLLSAEAEMFIQPIWVRIFIALMVLLATISLIGVATGAWLRRHDYRLSRLYTHSWVQFYTISLSLTVYMIGSLSIAAGAILASSICIGYVLLPKHYVNAGIISAALVQFSLITAAALEIIPYAPIYALSPVEHSVPHTPWVIASLLFTLPHLVLLLFTFETTVTHWQQREKLFEDMSYRDALTGIANRRYFFQQAKKMLSLCRRQKLGFAVALSDLDHFKSINDTFGHHVGDDVLKKVAGILQEEIRGEDVAGRYGGEEFALFLYDTDRQEAFAIVERCRLQVESAVIPVLANAGRKVTSSYGLCVVEPAELEQQPDDDKLLTELFHRADVALYKAKESGRNQVVFADASSDALDPGNK